MSCFKHTSKISYEEIHFEWEFPDNFLLSEMATTAPIKSDTFSFAKGSWILMVERGYYNYMDLYIGNVGCNNEIDVGYEIGLKKVDGSVEQFYTNRHDFIVGLLYCTRGISKSELLEQKHELAPPHGLTITCTMRRGTPHYHQQPVLHQGTPPALIKLEILSENFKSLFNDEDSCDVILQVKDKEFHAHKAVLMVRSPEFAAIFQHDTLEKQTTIINIPDCDPESFDEFLQFLYCGKLEDITFRSAFYLFCTSHKYGVQELKAFCIEYMERCLEEGNVCDVAKLADVYEEEKLLEAVQNFFNKNASNVLDTDEWDTLLKNNYCLAKRLIKGMASKVKIED